MSFYRCDDVNYYKLVLPRESAWQIMDRLGQQPFLHIVPSNSPVLARPFLAQVRRCEQALARLHSLELLLQEKGVYSRRQAFSVQAYEQIYRLWGQEYAKRNAYPMNVLNDLIGEVDHAWNYYQELLKNAEELRSKMQLYRDNLALLLAGEARFGRALFTQRDRRVRELALGLMGASQLNYRCGVVPLAQEQSLNKTVFRITKGNSILACVPFRQLFTNLLPAEQTRVAFFVLYPGAEGSYLDSKLQRLIQNFCEDKYELPQNEQEYVSIIGQLQKKHLQAENLLNLTQKETTQFLGKLGDAMVESSYFRRHEYLKLYLMKERTLYGSLNEMEFFNNFLQGSVYVRTQDIQPLQNLLKTLDEELNLPSGQLVPAHIEAFPTHFTVNDFTRSAQEIVETYGTANYKEANPAYFTCVTFPFLFGVMFGDIGHGLIILAFACWIIFATDQNSSNSMLRMIRPHRYMLALMGFFATYCGFIYNDYLSISLDLFGSCYPTAGVLPQTYIAATPGCVYPFGLDPVWSVAENNLNFVNSLKMKISVILGVAHMTLGIFIKATNSIHFGRWVDFFFEFVPQLAFMLLLFGYMDFLIFFKWTVDWGIDSPNAPSIITTMINIPLDLGKTSNCCGGQPMWGTFGDTSQNTIQLAFLLTALLCIPLMLCPKPIIEICCHAKPSPELVEEEEHNELQNTGRLLSGESIGSSDLSSSSSKLQVKQPAHGNDEIVVHQLIETIEYVLGCISNTASYLRLWALSLAHSQLSEVFFDKLVEGALISGYSGIPMMLIGFVFLAGLTFGILLCMDSMECFLHTLRLHWVEFNNKFYKGSGFPFAFYSFTDTVRAELGKQA